MKKILFLALFMFSNFSSANDFCLMFNNSTKCGFNSYSQCQKDSKGEGLCVPNTVFNTDSKYCLVSSLGENCVYDDVEICKKMAISVNATCELNQN